MSDPPSYISNKLLSRILDDGFIVVRRDEVSELERRLRKSEEQVSRYKNRLRRLVNLLIEESSDS